MIRKLKYHEIDFEKYTHCLENSQQRKYSATKSFLDITTDKKWELLVYNDYEAIMPIPYITKMGFKLVINPKLCQQLGIFSSKDDVQINDLFLDFAEKNYRIWYYAFNDVNRFSRDLKQRKNYLIYPENYESVRQRYSPKRKRKLRLDDEVLRNSEVKELNFKKIEKFITENSIGAKDDHDRNKFLKIFSDLGKANLIKFVAFIYKKKIINALAVYSDQNTIALLGTFNDKNYVKLSGSSVLIDHTIFKNIESKIFDFEGSEIPSVEEFFTGFRPVLKTYSVIQRSKQELIKGFFKLNHKKIILYSKVEPNFLSALS
ncbi:hypothetical protein CHRY9390_02998 [Chryseobacterium aquaeductus]|uniref:BioF2-like acetyltransferase domain-containing protein n=1 Tax=Chryseobacterium aquaeductus TaxID=2675056 RepID=A0A9N8QRQ0_9FLAO|nr:hypothetical protein [Chryseobacterium aquaeductus]CAA7332276.1 hypothetical protein CHRY9390_02998 [Chryseobacterium potabilaquae]CAD7815590.1 hypothetical protein CHRY9390_02998 [Chryseobacterium aquaeductus]